MRLLTFAIITAVLIGKAGFAWAEDAQPKPEKPKYTDSGKVEGIFVDDNKSKCEALCRRAYRSGRELSNDICIATCMHYP